MSEKTNIPQIRFKGFNDVWEQCKLGDKINFFAGLTYAPYNITNENGTLVLRYLFLCLQTDILWMLKTILQQ